MKMANDPIDAPCAWTVRDLAQDDTWRITLSTDEKAELISVSRRDIDLPIPGSEAAYEQDMPNFSRVMRTATQQLRDGRGLFLISGWPLSELTKAEIDRSYLVFGTALGRPMSQNVAGDIIGEVTDKGQDYTADINARGYLSRDELRPHTDGCDLTSLLCLRQAKTGGTTSLASSVAIHNRILQTDPDLLQSLYRGFYNDLRGYGAKGTGDETSDERWPVFVFHKNTLSAGFNGKTIRTAPLKNGVPLSADEVAAVDTFEQLAENGAFRLDLRLNPGDLIVFNNYTTIHKRSPFEDHQDPNQKRLLLRLWINDYQPRPLPAHIAKLAHQGIPAKQVNEAHMQ